MAFYYSHVSEYMWNDKIDGKCVAATQLLITKTYQTKYAL